jgi:hypothetical protein
LPFYSGIKLIDAGGDLFFEDNNGESCAKNLAVVDEKAKRELATYIKTRYGRKILQNL